MKLIFIYGMPATGKLTVARELAAITGFRLFHNHQVVDLLLSIFEFGSEPFVELREEFWLSVFAHACRNRLPGLIFTFAPESTVRPTFVESAIRVLRENGGEVDFVELICPAEELKRRLGEPSRREFGKLTSTDLFDELYAGGKLDSSHMPKSGITIDTSLHRPSDTASRIAVALQLPIYQDRD